MTEQTNPKSADEDRGVAVRRIYLKDVSFETPNSPVIFTEEWNPAVEVELETSVSQLQDETFEVVLAVTVTARIGEKTAFLVEVHQAGIFTVKGMEEEPKNSMLGIFCPNTLFPYARQVVSELVTNGGFPSLLLAPISFKHLYEEKMARARSQATG